MNGCLLRVFLADLCQHIPPARRQKVWYLAGDLSSGLVARGGRELIGFPWNP